MMYMMLVPVKAQTNNLVIEDVDKTVLSRQPYQIEVCYQEQVPGDKSGDMIKGALLGGLLGNNIKGEVNGGAIGAVLGGMYGHSQSTATGKTHRLRFQK